MARSRGRGPTLAKDINRKLVYQLIKRKRRSSRVEAASLLHLNKNTVNSIVDEMLSAGFVQEFGHQETNKAGRKPIAIGFNAGNKWAIGAQVTSTVIHWTAADLYAKPLLSFSAPLVSCSPDRVVSALLEGIGRMTAEIPAAQCIGMCIGVPGLIEAAAGRIIRSSHLGWNDVPLLSMLEQDAGIRLLLDNSVKLASLGELWHGSGQGVDHFIYCYFGNGVGCSLVMNGSILRGDGNAAGELGHIVVDPDGPLCGCGNRGCLEALVGLPALLQRIGRSIGKAAEEISPELAMSELAAGHPAIASEFERAGAYIGQALSYAVNLFNPKLIICDGPLMQASSYLFPAIEKQLQRQCLSVTADRLTLLRSELFPLASCIGAAAGVIQAWEDGLVTFGPAT